MITKSIIKSYVGSQVYSRGFRIYQTQRVRSFEVEEDVNGKTCDHISALVKGSYQNEYSVYIKYNYETNEIEETDCQCMAYQTYEGLCKHCVAVLFCYEEYQLREETLHSLMEQQDESRARLGNLNSRSTRTHPLMKELLERQVLMRMLPILEESIYGKVHLEPHLTCNRDSASLEFKIGITHMYVMKNVYEFIDALQNCKRIRYGKKLEFVHTMKAFDESSQSMVHYLLQWAIKNGTEVERNVNHDVYIKPASSLVRQIYLDRIEMEEFMLAMKAEPFLAKINGRVESSWQLSDEPLQRTLEIKGLQRGIEVKTKDGFFFEGIDHYFYFVDGSVWIQERENATLDDFIKCMAKTTNQTVFIERKDVSSFCQELLPVLKEYYQCEYKDFDENDYQMEPVEFKIYLDAPQRDRITVKVWAVYGEEEYEVYGNKEDAELRDLVTELNVGNMISSYCTTYDKKHRRMLIEDEDQIYDLWQEGISRMQDIGEVYISEALKKMSVTATPKINVGVSLDGNMLELKITSGDISKQELLEILTKYDRKKKYFRLKSGEFLPLEGSEMETLLDLKKGLSLTEKDFQKEQMILPKFRALYIDSKLREHQEINTTKDKEFRALIRNMKTVDDNDFEVPASLEDTLREYQKRGYLWIKTLQHNGFCGILADDMGLGKTLQVITFLLAEKEEGKNEKRHIIVAPASLVYNWENEIHHFAPSLSCVAIVGNASERQQLIKETKPGDILLTSYDLLKRDVEYYKDIEFSLQVIDEAQYIKNHVTKAAKAVKEIQSDFRLALTGTPIENRLSELWSIFDYLMPGFLYGYQRFRQEFEIPIVQEHDEQELKHLQKLIGPFVLRRLKSEVLADLPDKIEKNVFAKLEGEQQRIYDANVANLQLMLEDSSEAQFNGSKIQILAELMKLRQLCCDPALILEDYQGESAKLDMCMDLIENAIEGGHKILLFSQFTTMLERIENRMRLAKIRFYKLTGGTKKKERIQMVDAFNQDDTQVFCISLKAGGTGLNLTAADIVIHYDPWWNVAVQNQATDRAHRIGQQNVVTVYRLIAKDTIEENIVRLQEQKMELADQLLSGDGMSTGSFTKEELLALLEHS